MKKSLLASLFCIAVLLSNATVYFVKGTGSDAGTGLTWNNAFATLQKALDIAVAGDTIWIAKGKYIPTANGTGKNVTFKLRNNLAIYGGFAGTETSLADRNAALIHTTNETILSGDVNGDDSPTDATLTVNKTDNAYRVISNVTADAITGTAYLDGVTVSGGHAISGTTTGAGIYIQQGSPTFNNIIVRDNIATNGAGFYVTGATAVLCTPVVTNSSFINNIANTTGGGLYLLTNASPSFTNVTISGNKALGTGTANGGGGAYIINSTLSVYPSFINVTITSNTSGNKGGGAYIWGSSPVFKNAMISNNTGVLGGGAFVTPNGTNTPYSYPLFTNALITGNSASKGGGLYFETNTQAFTTNSTFAGNSADWGAGIYDSTNTGFNSKVRNSIIWGNTGLAIRKAMNGAPVASYSLIEGSGGSGTGWNTAFGTDSIGNIAVNPVFVTGGYALQVSSPAINTGSDALYTAVGGNLTTDTCNDGTIRKRFAAIDMGAFESQNATTPVTLLSFTAQKTRDGKILTEWKVATENTWFYELQKSTGASFSTIGTINAEQKPVYNFTDIAPSVATNYYRLKIVDRDGSIAYSKTVAVNFSTSISIAAYPVPSRNTVTISNSDASLNGKTALITDLNGRTVHQFTLNAQSRIDVSGWATGMYLLKVPGATIVKLIVE